VVRSEVMARTAEEFMNSTQFHYHSQAPSCYIRGEDYSRGTTSIFIYQRSLRCAIASSVTHYYHTIGLKLESSMSDASFGWLHSNEVYLYYSLCIDVTTVH
jgi:hypothetical protein